MTIPTRRRQWCCRQPFRQNFDQLLETCSTNQIALGGALKIKTIILALTVNQKLSNDLVTSGVR